MGMLGPTELVLIIGVIAIFFFGKGKVMEWARSLGDAKKEFNDAKTEVNGNGQTKKTIH